MPTVEGSKTKGLRILYSDMGNIVAEFTLDPGEFAFGDALFVDPPMEITVERFVPAGDAVMPYMWVRGENFEAFEGTARDDPHVVDLVEIDERGGERLYRVEWAPVMEDLLRGFTRSEGVIMNASGHRSWEFRIRFRTHQQLQSFIGLLVERSITPHLDRVYTLRDLTESEFEIGLTPEQREAVTMAFEEGYFSVPRKTTIQAIADELGISDQATSERLRRGIERVLQDIRL